MTTFLEKWSKSLLLDYERHKSLIKIFHKIRQYFFFHFIVRCPPANWWAVGHMLMLGILTCKARAWNTFVKKRIEQYCDCKQLPTISIALLFEIPSFNISLTTYQNFLLKHFFICKNLIYLDLKLPLKTWQYYTPIIKKDDSLNLVTISRFPSWCIIVNINHLLR